MARQKLDGAAEERVEETKVSPRRTEETEWQKKRWTTLNARLMEGVETKSVWQQEVGQMLMT
jgi:hypothetical protein